MAKTKLTVAETFERNAIKCPACGALDVDELYELGYDDFEWTCYACQSTAFVGPHMTVTYRAKLLRRRDA